MILCLTNDQVEPVVTVIKTTQDPSSARTEIDKDRVVWRFRFEYCSAGQDSPWWEPASKTEYEALCPYVATNESARSWFLSADHGSPTMSVVRKQDEVNGDTHGAMKDCRSCGYSSCAVFRNDTDSSSNTTLCLNESCDTWNHTAEYFSTSNDITSDSLRSPS